MQGRQLQKRDPKKQHYPYSDGPMLIGPENLYGVAFQGRRCPIKHSNALAFQLRSLYSPMDSCTSRYLASWMMQTCEARFQILLGTSRRKIKNAVYSEVTNINVSFHAVNALAIVHAIIGFDPLAGHGDHVVCPNFRRE